MTYTEAEKYLLSLSNLPRQEYMGSNKKKPDYLKRLQFFLDLLGNPEKKIPHYIHVTGTSGKGSVCTFLSFILQAAGKTVGLTISPHATTLRERWQINNRLMSEQEFTSIITKFKPALDAYIRHSPYDVVSYFDLSTAIALHYFAQKKVDYAVIEVGCGGRFDSTNIIPHKDIAIITNIGRDHLETIGPTLADVAYEKSGIIKKGCRVFTMEKNKKLLSIIENECKKKKAALHILPLPGGARGGLAVRGPHLTSPGRGGSILGTHQQQNLSLCKAVAESLNIPEQTIEKGISQAKQPLRLEVISEHPLIIVDGAHNEDKIKSTVTAIHDIRKNSMNPSPRRRGQAAKPRGAAALFGGDVHLVVGFSHDKDIRKMIRLLCTLNLKSASCTRNMVNPFRKVAHPKDIANLIKKYSPQTKVEIFLDPAAALRWSKQQVKRDDILLVTGSIFLSGEIKANLKRD